MYSVSPNVAPFVLFDIGNIGGLVNDYRPERVLRTAPKVKMKVDFTDKERVRRSPFYNCNHLWEKLDSSIQTSCNIIQFSKRLHVIPKVMFSLAVVSTMGKRYVVA